MYMLCNRHSFIANSPILVIDLEWDYFSYIWINQNTIIGQTNHRNQYHKFGIKQSDRLHHMYILGKTGVGKSTLIKNMILQDINAGRGCALLDPHGDLVSEIVEKIPKDRKDNLIYLNVPDPNLEWGYNPLVYVNPERRPLLASGIMDIFKKQWDGRILGCAHGAFIQKCFVNVIRTTQCNNR